jgi:hypothetical protein
MAQTATLQCQSCLGSFASEMPLSRSGSLGSTLMFMAEQCPACGHVATYLRWQYRLDTAGAAPVSAA